MQGFRGGILIPPRSQRGQAIVLVALMLVVVVGMAALAIDGSRAYALRRDLQAALDSAALAAGDNYQRTRSFPSAEAAATTIFGTNLRLYNSPSCSPGYLTPGASPVTIVCTYSDATTLTQVVANSGPAGVSFSLAATRNLALQFARILTNGNSAQVAASGSSAVGGLVFQPTLAALSQAGCGGMPGSAISIPGGGALSVIGDVISNGAISIPSATATVAGDTYARCQPSVTNLTSACYASGLLPPCTYPDVLGTVQTGYSYADPNYSPPTVVGGPQSRPGNNVILAPGTYGADPAFVSTKCYFLAGGVYMWEAGYTNNGAFVSNELKPPDEPRYNANTQLAPHQFWDTDGVNCHGSAQVTAISGPNPLPNQTWALVLTSTRNAVYNGVTYLRESAPSFCYTITTNGSTRLIQVRVSNVPGATAYNIYVAPNGSCAGPFGFADTLPVFGTPSNNSTFSCPVYSGSGCSLGNEGIVLDSTILGAPFGPNAAAPPDTLGAYPPASEAAPLRSNLPNENADRAPPPAGDRANENQCDAIGGALSSCPAPVTPGAVSFYIPSGGCLNATSGGDDFYFGGYQYNWVLVYEPGNGNPPANTCANTLAAAFDSAFIGYVYMPAASVTISKASTFRTDESGGILANTIGFQGQLPTIIGDPTDFGPVAPASRLIS
ncbi:MAG TPA: pilus assembly protein TadG-related protein [Candidatus Dormibacteraeota bacterium]|nr:pilus assembly protein TadG-related protein [Candidatus Dormibacteraeota bacterium]